MGIVWEQLEFESYLERLLSPLTLSLRKTDAVLCVGLGRDLESYYGVSR